MSSPKIPENIRLTVEAHKKWLEILKKAEEVVGEDAAVQKSAAKGARMKGRQLPPEVIGRSYAQYCRLINSMYCAYLDSEQLQRANYMLHIIAILVKRMYELRKELVHIIVNDYIYVDSALTQLHMTPPDIQIIIPYHFPLESRKDNVEQALQKMWADAVRRKNRPPKQPKIKPVPIATSNLFDDDFSTPQQELTVEDEVESDDDISTKASIHTETSEAPMHAIVIQMHERFRQWFIRDFKMKCVTRRIYFTPVIEGPALELKVGAARLIQKVYRAYMKQKRDRLRDIRRDILLGVIPDPFKPRLNYREENEKVYAKRRNTRMKIEKMYWEEMERENKRLVFMRRDDQIDDITVQIREWFKEWYYNYGFLPQYPYDVEGGTVLVIREDFPTIEEQILADEKYIAATKGKTKEQLQDEKEQAKADAEMKAELEKEKKQKEEEALFKARCNPLADPGYSAQQSGLVQELIDALNEYRSGWSVFDSFPPETYGEAVYGFMKPLLTEELMCQLHKECREYVDEIMRLDLKLLIKAHQIMYKRLGWKYPKMRLRPKPRPPSPPPKRFEISDELLKRLEGVFDLGIVSRPTVKISDIYGDLNYAAYDLNTADPDAQFPPPGYGDIRRRLVLSCVLGSGLQPGAPGNRAVMLLGPERNGKSFLVDAVAGEMNAIKIDISPEVFSAVLTKPAKMLAQVIAAARVFQPAVIYMRNIERVFYKKTPPQDKKLRATKLKSALGRCIKQITSEDKVIFIATCAYPLAAKRKPLVSVFNEIIVVPRTEYGTVQRFFYDKLQSIRSMPRDYCVQPLAQMLQGYGFGVILEVYETIMTAARIMRLNIDPLSAAEFLEVLIEREYEPITLQDYEVYTKFYIENSPLKKERMQYEIINKTRAAVYQALAKKQAEAK